MNTLKLFTLVKLEDGTESRVPFPNNVEQAEISTYEYSASRMGGAPSITAKISHRFCLDKFWNEKQFVEFNGEKFFVRDTPSSSKNNDDSRYEHDVTFLHERFVLEKVYMIDAVQKDDIGTMPVTDKYVSNSTKFVFWGNIQEFVGRFNACLKHAKLGDYKKKDGYYVVVDSSVSEEDLTKELLVSFEDKFFSEALQEMYNVYNIPYYWQGKVCHVGEGVDSLEHFVFEYGADNELLSIEKQNNNEGYCNRATGVGSSDNLPYYYPNTTTPDATIPHAVVGNNGITSDSQLSVVDKTAWFSAHPELPTVNVVEEETSMSWQGKALQYMDRGKDVLKIIEPLYVGIATPDWVGERYVTTGDPEMGLGWFSDDRWELIGGEETLLKLGQNFLVGRYLVETLIRVYNERFDDALKKGIYTENARTNYIRDCIFKHSWRVPNYSVNVPVSIKQDDECTCVHVRCKMSYGKENVRLYLKGWDVRGRVREDWEDAGFSAEEVADESWDYLLNEYPFKDEMNRIEILKDVDEEGYFNFYVEIFNAYRGEKFGNRTFGGYYLLLDFEMLDEPKQYNRPPVNTGNSPYGTDYCVYEPVCLDVKVDIENVRPRWFLEGTKKMEKWAYNWGLDHWGLHSSVGAVDGDRIVKLLATDILDKIIPVSNVLMPSVYRDTNGEESFYNAYDNPTIYDDFYTNDNGEKYDFEHEYSDNNPREGKFEFPDIKPSIKGITNAEGKRLDRFIDVAFDGSDSDNLKDNIFTPVVDDDGKTIQDTQSKDSSEYAHPYFYVKLPKTNTEGGHQFNLFACAVADGSEMIFSMTSGLCGGCNFTVMVDEDTKRNPVLICKEERRSSDGTLICAEGDILRDDDGNVVFANTQTASNLGYKGFQEEQQVTNDNEVWICLRKETETYGIIMPNASSQLRPDAQDSFVIININLPLAYVKDAEDRLSKAIIKAMWENNFEKFNFSIKLSRVFCEQNKYIASKINENAILRIGYNGDTIPLYVNSFSYKNGDEILPELSVELSSRISLGSIRSKGGQSSQNIDGKQIILSGTTSIPVITSVSEESPTDQKVYSALRAKNEFLSKKHGDSTPYDLTAMNLFSHGKMQAGGMSVAKEFATSKYSRGAVGARKGAYLDEEGNLYVNRLFVEDSLTVPSITYSRAMVMFGVFVVSPAVGKILDVSPDFDAEGKFRKTGWITLDLEEGEAGSVAVGDMLLGFWHNLSKNSNEDLDGTWDEEKRLYVRDGNYKMKGFNSIYFRVIEIDETDSQNSRFKYELRSVTDDTWTDMQHPAKGMSFYGFGNMTDEDRQSIYIMTREYNVRLINKNWWTYNYDNIIEVNGKLDGFAMRAKNRAGQEYIKWFSGYGRVGGNEYIFGSIDQFERIAYRMEIDQSLGGSIAPNETETVSVKILSAYGEDVTERFTRMSVTRTTGDEPSDAVWNAEHTQVSNPFEIGFNDLGIDGIHKTLATFYVTATDETNDDEANAAFDYFS